MNMQILLPAHGKTWTPPTPAQAEAGNYYKPALQWKGMTVKIENPAGSVRKWGGGKTLMHFDYGYLRGTDGVDGDEVDVYLGPSLDFAPMVYVVHQRKKGDWGRFDEDKAMLGFLSEEQARDAYLKQYDDPRFLGSITAMTVDEFKEKARATKGKSRMIKAHVAAYTRHDGTTVRDHEDRRPSRKKRYPDRATPEAAAAMDALKAIRRGALREAFGAKLDSYLVAIHASNEHVRELVKRTGQPAESVAEVTLDAMAGMDPKRLVRLHGWADLIGAVRSALRDLTVALRRAKLDKAADWLQWQTGEWTDDDLGRMLLRADKWAGILTKGHSMNTLNRLLGNFGQSPVAVLFLKSYVRPTSYVKNGKTVQRRGYSDSRTKKLEGGGGKDPYTGDLFADQAPPKKPIGPSPFPEEAMRNPEKFTPDLFGSPESKETFTWKEDTPSATSMWVNGKRALVVMKYGREWSIIGNEFKDQILTGKHGSKEGAMRAAEKLIQMKKERGDASIHAMPKKEAIAEHERLVDVLESPSHADDKEEAKKQGAELAAMKAPTNLGAKVTPQVLSDAKAEQFIQIAADGVSKLRAVDVDRVMHETPAHYRLPLSIYIKKNRPDLAGEVNEAATTMTKAILFLSPITKAA